MFDGIYNTPAAITVNPIEKIYDCLFYSLSEIPYCSFSISSGASKVAY